MSETANLIALWMSVGFAHGKVPDGIGFRGGTLYSNILKNGFYLSPWSSVLLLSLPTALSVIQGAFVTELHCLISRSTSVTGRVYGGKNSQSCCNSAVHKGSILMPYRSLTALNLIPPHEALAFHSAQEAELSSSATDLSD